MERLIPLALKLLPYIGAAIAGIYISYRITSWAYEAEINTLNIQHEKALDQAVLDERNLCSENLKITQEASYAVQSKNADLNRRLASLNDKLRAKGASAACVSVARPASRHDAATGGNELSGKDGIMAESLLAMSATCDRQTAQLVACQQFIRQTWERHQGK